ncbi:DUF305 domain-containing protein [Streptomyces sp. NPDC058877]|uniref:DUF305 domain-containing protein n=1 Tax=Streptomyces sp. NPDC058877 TaxID=3346665 RepID=UPI003675F9F0
MTSLESAGHTGPGRCEGAVPRQPRPKRWGDASGVAPALLWVAHRGRLPAPVDRFPSRQFPTMMAEHHEGGAGTAEQRQAACGPIKTLTDDIVISQTAEIARMRTIPNVPCPATGT